MLLSPILRLPGRLFSGYNWLCNLLASNKRFDYIDLEDNSIKTGGGTAIPDFITKNPSLQKLCLTKNNLNDEDATSMEMLKNSTIVQVFLTCARILVVGIQNLQ